MNISHGHSPAFLPETVLQEEDDEKKDVFMCCVPVGSLPADVLVPPSSSILLSIYYDIDVHTVLHTPSSIAVLGK